jgi:hypothetical protein
MTTELTEIAERALGAPSAFILSTEGYGVEIDAEANQADLVQGLTELSTWEEDLKEAGINSRWYVARACLEVERLYGTEVVAEAFTEKNARTVLKAMDTAKQFTVEEVAGFPALSFTHFQEVAFTGGLDHEERIDILAKAEREKLSTLDTRKFAKEYVALRDNTEEEKKPVFLLVPFDPGEDIAYRSDVGPDDFENNRVFKGTPKQIYLAE